MAQQVSFTSSGTANSSEVTPAALCLPQALPDAILRSYFCVALCCPHCHLQYHGDGGGGQAGQLSACAVASQTRCRTR